MIGVFGTGHTQRIGAILRNSVGESVVHVGGLMEPDTGVVVVVIVPIHEAAYEGPCLTR